VIVQNVPGAGGLTLMNQLYNISPKDGTFVGLINRACHSRSCSAVKACSSIRCG
jgi:hypothetical protein